MGVRLEEGAGRGFLLCDSAGCTARSESYRAPADDPEGAVYEQAHQTEGWSCTYGFLSEVVGRLTYCPKCNGHCER